MIDREQLLAQMRADPADEGPRLVYADWLLSQGDERGELIVLDHRERTGAVAAPGETLQLLELAIRHGFPRLPDDPDAGILQFESSFDAYQITHGGRRYRLSRRRQIELDVDGTNLFIGDLGLDSRWTFRQTNAILAIASEAIAGGASPRFPSDLAMHPAYRVGREPAIALPVEFLRGRDNLTGPLRDYVRWRDLWERHRALPNPPLRVRAREQPGCACGVRSISCQVVTCA